MAGKVNGPTATIVVDADVQKLNKLDGAVAKTREFSSKVDQLSGRAQQSYDKIGASAASSANTVVEANRRIAESEKRLTAETLAQVHERKRAADIERETAAKNRQVAVEQAKAKKIQAANTSERLTGRQRTAGQLSVIDAMGKRDVSIEGKKQETRLLESAGRLQLASLNQQGKQANILLKDQLDRRKEIYRKANRELAKDSSQAEAILRRSLQAPAEMQAKINAAIGGSLNQTRRFALRSDTVGRSQTFNKQLTDAIGAENAAYLVSGGKRPAALGGAGGGKGGGISGMLSRLLGGGGGGIAGSLVSGVAGGLGIGLGGYALAGAVRGVGEDVDKATAYERQTIAARNLAGSQAKLNQLIEAYGTASGNAIDKVTTLSNVTRLMATGFADSAPEVEKFVRATRGASIALGKPQDYVIQETQLAISNVSKKRLDQIGLGIREVDERIERLRQTNANWTRETAFQNAVLDIMDEKYGKLTKTAEGQATGVEKLRKSWADLRLEMGKNAKPGVDETSEMFSEWLNYLNSIIGDLKEIEDRAKQIGAHRSIGGFIVPDREAGRLEFERKFKSTTFTDDSQSFVVAPKARGRTDEQTSIISDFYTKFAELERNFEQQRTNTVIQYNEQRNSLIENYAKQMLRSEQDFQRGRARSLEDYERSILDIMRDARERETEAQEDLDERISELREAGGKRVAEIEEKFREDREKSEAEHRDRMLSAAGRLDAIAVLEERKRFKRENEEKEKGYKDALEEVKENLEEQVQEAKEAHLERLEDARKADEKRLQDMASSRERQLARENEDRAIQLARAAEDHDAQLAELDRLHAATMAKLASDYAEQKALFEEEFAEAMHKAGVYIEGVAAKLIKKQELEEQWFDEMIAKYETLLRIRKDEDRYNFDPNLGPQIPLNYGASLGVSAPSVSSSATSNSSRTLVVNEGAFQVTVAPGAEIQVGQIIEDTVISLLEAY